LKAAHFPAENDPVLYAVTPFFADLVELETINETDGKQSGDAAFASGCDALCETMWEIRDRSAAACCRTPEC